ncbi:hypothetical protein OROMI_003562 [Orobanche minor]
MPTEDGGAAVAAGAEANSAPTKRTRRPSVRLHEPYHENLPDHRKLQWNPVKGHPEGAKKPRTLRTVQARSRKNDGTSDASKGEKLENLNFDDDGVAIGNWKNIDASNRERDFKRKRVRPSSSKKRVSAKSRPNEDQENQNRPLFIGSESGKQGEWEKQQEEDGDGNNSNLVAENTDMSSPNCAFGNDDGNDKLSDDSNYENKNQGMEQRELRNSRDTNEMGGDMRIREGDSKMNGVRVWLNELGLDKYAPWFEVHEVDDEVLAQLTLEDLKDMGINAVGSRRKMYSSIQKLGKGFS